MTYWVPWLNAQGECSHIRAGEKVDIRIRVNAHTYARRTRRLFDVGRVLVLNDPLAWHWIGMGFSKPPRRMSSITRFESPA
jgi:hypothetical protein